MRLYSAFDLHLSNRYLGIIDETGKVVQAADVRTQRFFPKKTKGF